MVNRDYNHPSIVFYSIGNEVAEPHEEKGIKVEKELIDLFHKLDPTRAVTCGFNIMIVFLATQNQSLFPAGGSSNTYSSNTNNDEKRENKIAMTINSSTEFNAMAQQVGPRMNMAGNTPEADAASTPGLDLLDIAGYNYASGRYPLDGEQHPNRILIGSETFPFDIAKNWEMVEKFLYLIGDFMWTALDYIGETGAGAWSYTTDGFGFTKPYPWLLADVGTFDILGNENAELGYAMTVLVPIKDPILRGTNALPSWPWRVCEGNKANVEVYDNCDHLKLFVNGKEVGDQKVEEFKTLFNINYEPGILEAVSFDADGNEKGRSKLTSAKNDEEQIFVIPEENEVQQNDIVYINVNIADSKGIVESNSDVKIKVDVDGGELLAFGSANPRTEERFDAGQYTTYYGRSLAVVKCTKKGNLTFIAEDQNGRKSTAQIHIV